MIVRLVALGNIGGSFQGRMELGPYAVGGRWLLDDPRRAEIKDRVNVSRIRRKL